MSESLRIAFEEDALDYLNEKCLFKLMESSNGVLVDLAHKCVLSIVYNTQSLRVLK